jgi:hypothetical protein
MSKIDASILWAPKVVAKDKLDEHRWAYLVEAPFDMPAEIPLIGMRVSLDGRELEIRGFVARMPAPPIKEGELIELLVALVTP